MDGLDASRPTPINQTTKDRLVDSITKKLGSTQSEELDASLNVAEFETAIRSMSPHEAPGPVGTCSGVIVSMTRGHLCQHRLQTNTAMANNYQLVRSSYVALGVLVKRTEVSSRNQARTCIALVASMVSHFRDPSNVATTMTGTNYYSSLHPKSLRYTHHKYGSSFGLVQCKPCFGQLLATMQATTRWTSCESVRHLQALY